MKKLNNLKSEAMENIPKKIYLQIGEDADVSKQIEFDNDWCIAEQDADDKANEMHEAVVLEITEKLLKGYKFEVSD